MFISETVSDVYLIEGVFGTALLHQNQLRFTKFILEQFYIKVATISREVWLSFSSSFMNGKFGGKDLFDWMRGKKRRGIHLLVDNFLSTPASIILFFTKQYIVKLPRLAYVF